MTEVTPELCHKAVVEDMKTIDGVGVFFLSTYVASISKYAISWRASMGGRWYGDYITTDNLEAGTVEESLKILSDQATESIKLINPNHDS